MRYKMIFERWLKREGGGYQFIKEDSVPTSAECVLMNLRAIRRTGDWDRYSLNLVRESKGVWREIAHNDNFYSLCGIYRTIRIEEVKPTPADGGKEA